MTAERPVKRSPVRAALAWILAGCAGLLAVMVVGVAVLMWPVLLEPPAPDFPPPADRTQANLQDLRYLERFARVNRSFSPTQRAAFLAQVRALERRAGDLDPATLEMGVARAVALAGDAHTNVRGAAWGLSLNAIPLRLAWFREGLFVVAADPANADLLGARVVTEAGFAPEAWLGRLRPFVGGPSAFLRERAPQLLISPGALKGAGLASAGDAIGFRFELADGRMLDRTVAAIAGPANGPTPAGAEAASRRRNRWPRRELSPVPFPGDARPWVRLAPTGAAPLYLSRPDDFYWRTYLPEQRALYVQINATEDQAGRETLTDFLAATVDDARRRRVRDVIVDLRFNTGGDATKANTFAEALPRTLQSDGRLFILTSGNSFSAAIITTARLKHFAGARAVIVGERIGDDEQFWAEGHDFVLPNSRIVIKSTAAYHDWEHGCGLALVGRCYLFNYVWGVAAGDLSPTVPAPLSMADYRAGRDPALVAIAALRR